MMTLRTLQTVRTMADEKMDRETLLLPRGLSQAVEDYRWGHRIKTRQEALRLLIEMGLGAGDIPLAAKIASVVVDAAAIATGVDVREFGRPEESVLTALSKAPDAAAPAGANGVTMGVSGTRRVGGVPSLNVVALDVPAERTAARSPATR